MCWLPALREGVRQVDGVRLYPEGCFRKECLASMTDSGGHMTSMVQRRMLKQKCDVLHCVGLWSQMQTSHHVSPHAIKVPEPLAAGGSTPCRLAGLHLRAGWVRGQMDGGGVHLWDLFWRHCTYPKSVSQQKRARKTSSVSEFA